MRAHGNRQCPAARLGAAPRPCERRSVWERTTEEESAIYAHNTFQHLNVSFIESLLLGASSCIVPGAITVEKERLRRPKPQNVTLGASSSFVRIATSAFSRLAMLFGNVPLCVHPDEEAQ